MFKKSNLGLKTDVEHLIENGLDFLDKAINQIKSEPKHSIINFYNAVEILIKVPLVLEHWTLVVSDKYPDLKKYKDGDFISVNFNDACTRHDKVLNKPIPKEAQTAFNLIRTHRNRMVHFYHKAISPNEIDNIISEQANAWFELNKLITTNWADQFEDYKVKFHKMDKVLVFNDHYAKYKFNDLRERINNMTQSGEKFKSCPSCHLKSFHIVHPVEGKQLVHATCLVCLTEQKYIYVECPECDLEIKLEAHQDISCVKCQTTFDKYELLSDDHWDKHNYFEANTPASCDECQGFETVCQYGDQYLCTECMEVFDTIYSCEACSGHSTLDREDSYFMGCEHCDGMQFKDD